MRDLDPKRESRQDYQGCYGRHTISLLNTPVLEHHDNNLNHVANVDIPNRYELPPRSTSGIFSRRYDLDYEALRSKYIVNTDNNEALSQTTVAFNTFLYSSFIP